MRAVARIQEVFGPPRPGTMFCYSTVTPVPLLELDDARFQKRWGKMTPEERSALPPEIRDQAFRRYRALTDYVDKSSSRLRREQERRQDAETSAALRPVVADEQSQLLAEVMASPTEDGVARLFAAYHEQELRYCRAFGSWFFWTGTHWRPERTDLAFDYAAQLARSVNLQRKASVARATFARGVESLARAARCFAAGADAWDSDEFALNTPAGTVDLRDGRLRNHDRAERLTKVTNVAPAAGPKPVFDAFMMDITCGDVALVDYNQRSLGATLSGARVDHWLLFWIGDGRNGKNTLGELVEWILGDYAKTVPAETLMSAHSERHPTELANLRGVRLAVSSEVAEGAHWNENRIKALTGDRTISARFMRGDFFEFERGHKHLIYGNHRPQLRTVDQAMRARLHVVPFKAVFTDELGNRDPNIAAKLREEAPAILAWLIEGHIKWQEDGFALRKCRAVQEETQEYFEAQSTPLLWVAERCERVPNDERPVAMLHGASVLYHDFAQWKEARGETPMSMTRWGEWMGHNFIKVRHGGVKYRGLKLIREGAPTGRYSDQ